MVMDSTLLAESFSTLDVLEVKSILFALCHFHSLMLERKKAAGQSGSRQARQLCRQVASRLGGLADPAAGWLAGR